MSERHDHAWTQGHVYLGAGHARAESRTRLVVIVTIIFMTVEIAAGLVFGSMALLADGAHMATHVGALGLAAGAYWMARRHAADRRFSFGSGKFGDLAGFSSALVLGIISLGIAVESAMRLFAPVPIRYNEAILVAGLGLLVNILSAFMLADHDHDHGHDHGHDHDHGQEEANHQDYNMRAAYVHILADAATSVLALLALGAGALFGLSALDPVVGIIGAVVIASWAVQLMRQAGLVLLDVEDDPSLSEAIRRTLEDDLHARIADLHLWRLGPGHRGLIVSLVSPVPCSADDIKAELRRRHSGLSHVTIEVSVCQDCAPA
ncbi:MAG TPA: CDF family Co(II)/Ni(II) efflux transporter DmeF [Micropepsaceae bacterium]|jgi:cation diffusion facilitator family transporter